MTADVDPAAGLVERAAAAFAGERARAPADDGYFGPGSVTWRLNGDLSGPLAGLRSLLVRRSPACHGRGRPAQRLARRPGGPVASTSAYLATITFGPAAADRAAARVRKIHERVRGTDPADRPAV